MMDSTLLKRSGMKLLPILLTLTASPGLLRATNLLTVTPSTATLTCNTASGTTPVSIVVKSIATPGSSGVVVTFAAVAGGLIVSPSTATLTSSNNGTGVTFTATLAPGCAGVTNAATQPITFKDNGASDAAATVTTNVTVATDPLIASPSPVTVTCVYNSANGGSWTPGPAQTISVTSAANGGTPVAVTSPPTWLTVGSVSGSPATTSPATFTVQAAAGCNGLTSGTASGTITIGTAPVPTKSIAVTLQIVPPTPITFSPNVPSLTYVKGSGSPGKVSVALSAPNAVFFQVNTATMPSWLTVDSLNGTTPKSLTFSSTSVGDTLAPGTYNASVHLQVSGYGDLALPVTMLLTNTAPKLTVAEGTTRNINWTIGQPLPTPVVTAVSSDTPIAYTVTTGGTLAPTVPSAEQSGLAYSFGTPISVSFNPIVFGAATPNAVLTGTVTLTWGSPASTVVVTFNVTVLSPGATVSGLSPASIPTAVAPATFTLTLNGTGFVPVSDPTQKTRVGIIQAGSANAITSDTNISVNVINSSNIVLTITVPATADPLLPFSPTASPAGGSVVIGVCNPVGGTCNIATGTATLTIGANPIIQAVTSSSSLIQVTPPTLPSVSPYDMISIFGSNFCSQNGTGCSTNQVLYGAPDPVLQTYPTTLTPDSCTLVSGVCTPAQRLLSVSFYNHGTSTLIGTAPLLFATNGQINALVPSGVLAQVGHMVDVVVNFGTGSIGSSTMKSSTAFSVNAVATDPGLFTIGADGQGSSAALDSNYALISGGNPAALRSTSGDSDTIQLYLTGLGAPDSSADDSMTGGYAWSGDCASISTYLTGLNGATGNSLTSLDGALLNPLGLSTGRLVPCLTSAGADVPSVSVGGVAGTVTYAGWVASTVAGLYQINVTLPASGAGPFTLASGATTSNLSNAVQLPVTVTSNGASSQAGVTLWVQQRLKVAPPAAPGNAALTGDVGNPWTTTNNVVVATEGTAPYRYAVTSGLMPPGLAFNPATGVISGIPNANSVGSYNITVTATDSSVPVPLTGKVTFTLVIGGGVYLTHSGTTFTVTSGTANNSLTTETPTTGVAPFTYSIAAGGSSVTGLNISATGVVSTTAAIPAGSYNATVTATDSTAGTPLMGTDTWPLTVHLGVTRSALVAATAGSASTVTTLTSTGMTGTVGYALDATTAALGWVSIDSSGNVNVSTSCVHGTYSVTVTATDGTAPSNATAAGTGTISFTFTVN